MKHVKELVERWENMSWLTKEELYLLDNLLDDLLTAIAEDEKISTCTTNIDE